MLYTALWLRADSKRRSTASSHSLQLAAGSGEVGTILQELGLPCSRSLIVSALLHQASRDRQDIACIICGIHSSHSDFSDSKG